MGRKKRKAAEVEGDTSEATEAAAVTKTETEEKAEDSDKPLLASKYGLTAHSGVIITEDIYVSDGSEDEADNVDVVLSGSRMGLMRRGLVQPTALVQPNRQWTRAAAAATTAATEEEEADETERERQREQELAKLDPAERAARILIEKQQKEEQEKEAARQKESEENAGRDPTLFSKRTAFDIRFDQVEDKPWTRGGDMSEFFNYGFMEDDWQVYAEQQLQIRQELIDAARQKRAHDPMIVPVTPRTTDLSNVSAKLAASGNKEEQEEDAQGSSEPAGPALAPVKKDHESAQRPEAPKKAAVDIDVGDGGAWGAGAAPGTYLAKLIEEQDSGGGQSPQGTAANNNSRGRHEYESHQNQDHRRHHQEDYGGGGFRGGRGGGGAFGRGGGAYEGGGRGGDTRKRPREDPRWRR